jgi:hypothetical protein
VHPVLSKTEDKPAEDPKEAPKEPKKKQPLDANSKKGLIIACVSIGVVALFYDDFLSRWLQLSPTRSMAKRRWSIPEAIISRGFL